MAAGPPYIRNVRKIEASEKLIAKLERGRVRLILGARMVENKTIARNPMRKADSFNPDTAYPRHNIPARTNVPFVIFERCSLFINGGC